MAGELTTAVETCTVTYAWHHEQAMKAELRERDCYGELVREAREYGETPVHVECTLH